MDMALNGVNRLSSHTTFPLFHVPKSKFLLRLPLFRKFDPSSLSFITYAPSSPLNTNDVSSSREETLLNDLKQCSNIKDLEPIHAQIIQSGFQQHPFVIGKIIEFCATSGRNAMEYAETTFGDMEFPDAFLWNTMIRGFGNTQQPEKAFSYYSKMRLKGKEADNFTFSFLLKVCGRLGSLKLGQQIHCTIVTHGLSSYLFVRNTLIHMYGSLKDIGAAHQLFEEMPNSDLVTWNTIIDCHVVCGWYKDAIKLFNMMLQNGIEPDDATLVVTLSACTSLGDFNYGRWIHSCIKGTRYLDITAVSNALIDMYAKCGAVNEASKIFDGMKKRNIVTWNTMISGLATHGYGDEAFKLFERMVDGKLEIPDGITFLAVLSACSHQGLIEEGRRFFDSMISDHDIKPSIKHYGCMVDLLSRAGLVDQAYQLIQQLPTEGNTIVWRTLLSACHVHGNFELGEKVRRHLAKLEQHSSDYVLLANMYASAERWTEMARERMLMRNRQIVKANAANSFTDAQNKSNC